MCSDGESVAGRCELGGGTRTGGEGPAVGVGPAEAEESRSPASRRGGGVWDQGPAGSGRAALGGGAKGLPGEPRLRRERGGKRGFLSFCRVGREQRGGCQSLGDLWVGGGRWRRRVGRRPPSCLRTKSREPGRGGGLHSSPRLARGGFARGCRKHFPNSGLGGRTPLLFCSQERKKWGGGSCCHVVAPVFRWALCTQLRVNSGESRL